MRLAQHSRITIQLMVSSVELEREMQPSCRRAPNAVARRVVNYVNTTSAMLNIRKGLVGFWNVHLKVCR